MEFRTFDGWNREIWEKVSHIYQQAFATKGGKPEKVIRNMLMKELCTLHIVYMEDRAVGMALTGRLKGHSALIIDYLAVDQALRNQGIGRRLVHYIINWASTSGRFDRIIIEVEAEASEQNNGRKHFWQECGFTPTDYFHQYIWVPEPYQAMYLHLDPDSADREDGKELFRYIGKFHKESFKGMK
ncbi:GNAT family N-acetyltransferase [Neobacillus sp. Marseille-QA0830]